MTLLVCLIKIRIIFQEVWRQGVKWDEKITEPITRLWKDWLKETHTLAKVQIPRCYTPKPVRYDSVQMHTFTDASDKAYSAAVYLRIQEGSQVYVSLVQSKARVAPLKYMTNPRLELQAAVVGSCIAKTITEELGIPIQQQYFWTDSKIVLSWIATKEKLISYVGSRVTKITDSTNKDDWQWIQSNLNPADLVIKLSNKADLSNLNGSMDPPF